MLKVTPHEKFADPGLRIPELGTITRESTPLNL